MHCISTFGGDGVFFQVLKFTGGMAESICSNAKATETNRIHLVLFGIQNRTLVSYFPASEGVEELWGRKSWTRVGRTTDPIGFGSWLPGPLEFDLPPKHDEGADQKLVGFSSGSWVALGLGFGV
jgi:hypothetical protein